MNYPRLVRFRYASEDDSTKVRQWNPVKPNFVNGAMVGLDTSGFTEGNSNNFVVLFHAILEPGFTIPWIDKKQDETITILLMHYNPLKKVEQQLSPGQKLKDLLLHNNGLPQEYRQDIKTFQEEIQEISIYFDLNLQEMVDKADMIVCCWGEFMEQPYQQKHIYQGKILGKVSVYNEEPDVIGVQGRPFY